MKTMITYFFLAAIFLINGCTSVDRAVRKSDGGEQTVSIKLPADVVPIKYDLSLWADPKAEDFSGNVAIDLQFLNERHDLYLHAQDLDVMSVHLEGNTGDREAKYTKVDDLGLARIDFDEALAAGHYRLSIAYRGKYRRDLSGLYKVNEDGEAYLFTQFEPLSARKMFPCFDEPRFKTPYNVKVITPKGQKVVANSSLKSTIDQVSDDVFVFDTTKPLPTYLLALAVGPLDIVEGKSLMKNKYRETALPFRAVATKGKGEKLRMALEETPKILSRLEEYFGVAYPYQKLDIIAIPDFAAGAMENAGAVTFREWYLLLDEQTASQAQRRDFYVVMAHELAHQWFGNSVTMPWWDDLWLNEAFATWLSYKIVDQIKPEYKSAERMISRAHDAMVQDSLMSARKIREPITSNHDIHNAFDSITYSKGGAVISMLESYLGATKFRDAVSSHVKRFEGKTATSRDFLESLAKFSDSTLVNSAESFLNQTGVPRVDVNYDCEGKGLRLKLEQSRYVPVGGKVDPVAAWRIPMCVSYDDGGKLKQHCFTLDQQSAKIDISSKTCPSFVMPNAKGEGYYRFALNLEAWKNLLGAKRDLLSEGDRLAMADSLVAEFHAGGLDFAFVAEGLFGLIDAKSSVLTAHFVKLMKDASYFWVSTENQPHAVAYAEKALKDIYSRLAKKRDLSSDQIALKKEIASFLANVVKDQDVRLELSTIGSSYRKSLEKLSDDDLSTGTTSMHARDEDLVSDGLAISLQYEDDDALLDIASNLSSLTDTVQRNHYLSGLAKAREGKDADLVRSLVFSKDLRRNEQLKLFFDHLDNPRNQPDTWAFLKANWPKFKDVMSEQQIANLPYLAEGLCDAASAVDVDQFFSPFIAEYQGGPRTLAEVTEQIEICAARKAHASVLANRFFDGLKDQAIVEREKSKP